MILVLTPELYSFVPILKAWRNNFYRLRNPYSLVTMTTLLTTQLLLKEQRVSKSDPHFVLQERFLDQPYGLAGRVIDPVSGTLSWQGKREHLRRKELEVLGLLASAEGKQVSRENFISVVWQGNDLVGDRGLTNTIVFLRRSLRDDDADQPLIRTIPRRGYQLAVSVQPVAQRVEEVELELVPGDAIPECPGWRLLRRLSKSAISDLWLAEPSEFGEREQALRVFRCLHVR